MNTDRFLSLCEAAEYLTSCGLRIAKQMLARLAATNSEGPAGKYLSSLRRQIKRSSAALT
jgi:hypothetical protein